MKPEVDQRLWTIDDVARYCCVKTSIVKHWVYNSDIPYFRLGKQVRFHPSEIRQWLETHKYNNPNNRDNGQLRSIT